MEKNKGMREGFLEFMTQYLADTFLNNFATPVIKSIKNANIFESRLSQYLFEHKHKNINQYICVFL